MYLAAALRPRTLIGSDRRTGFPTNASRDRQLVWQEPAWLLVTVIQITATVAGVPQGLALAKSFR